jgi:hypothetical protein
MIFMKKTQNRLLVSIKSFVFLFPILLIASFVLFYFVLTVFRGVVFGLQDAPIWIRLYRGTNFREIIETPTIYLSSIAFVSSLVGALWTGILLPKFSRFIWLQIIIIPWIAIILTGAVWGLIWSVNQWPAEGFTMYEIMMLFRRTDIKNGFLYSWLAAVQSYPLNILSYATFCGLLFVNKILFLKNDENSL